MGKLLQKAKDLPINYQFKPITAGEPLIDLPAEVVQYLSADQRYAYRMVKAVRSGDLPRELALQQPRDAPTAEIDIGMLGKGLRWPYIDRVDVAERR